ncbi:MAG: phosphate acyltransferase PlsX [Gammaproteobacteria bacterium WSBS_2016_MAG_OTU1]
MTSIAVDAMSGENDPAAAVSASLRMAAQHPDIHFFLCGKEAAIKAEFTTPPPDNITIENADEVVEMHEPPKKAMRRRGTSMRRAMDLVATKEAQTVVSAGNTGALLGIGLLVLKAIEGIHRPAIASFVPNANLSDGCCLLDLGANVECTADMLRQFALLGAVLTMTVRGITKPRVGLLNVGEEHFKGGEQLQQVAAMLKTVPDIDFIGNVEGFDLYLGNCDVIVCDGFTGNVALKASEGLARMISGIIKKEFQRDWLSSLCGAAAYPVLARLRTGLDSRRYNGACFLGLNGLVVKSHGNADAVAFHAALNYAARAAQHDLVAQTKTILQSGNV